MEMLWFDAPPEALPSLIGWPEVTFAGTVPVAEVSFAPFSQSISLLLILATPHKPDVLIPKHSLLYGGDLHCE
jgi:hypothetical protein